MLNESLQESNEWKVKYETLMEETRKAFDRQEEALRKEFLDGQIIGASIHSAMVDEEKRQSKVLDDSLQDSHRRNKEWIQKEKEWIQKEKEWIQKEKSWIQKENDWKKQKLSLEQAVANQTKKLNEFVREPVAATQAAIQKLQLNESLQENVKPQQEIEPLNLQQTKILEREFRMLLVSIGTQLTNDEWKSMSFTFDIPKNQQHDCAFKFFWWLVETNEISSFNLNPLVDLLLLFHRNDLVERFITPYLLKNVKM